MTISNTLADRIGQLDAQIKALTEELDALKEQAKASGLEQIEGMIFVVNIGKSICATLDTASLKKEMGQQWYDDHCKLAERTTVRIKPLPGALAALVNQ